MRVEVVVNARSGKHEVEKISDYTYKVYLKKPAEDNKANLELLKLLKEYFGGNVRILKGFRSRSKIVEIR